MLGRGFGQRFIHEPTRYVPANFAGRVELLYRIGQADAEAFEIPPALILTLVENGISYALDEGTVAFEIHQEITPEGQIRIVFRVTGRSTSMYASMRSGLRVETSTPSRV